MALFDRFSGTRTVNQFILHRGISAVEESLDAKVAQINSDLAVANIQSLNASFADEQGMTIGRRVYR